MLIWLGVVSTILALIGLGVLYEIFALNSALRVLSSGDPLRQFREERERAARDFTEKADRFISEFKQATSGVTKSQDNLADSLGALLREIRVSKQLAQGMGALGEQTIAAIDKLWKMIEMIRTGPRSAASIAPSDEEAAARERGESPEQQQAIEAMLASARSRLNEQSE